MVKKRYYWLKLKHDFFKTKEIKKLRKIAGGDTYTIIYLKMQLLSLDNDGKIYFEGVEATFAEELALELDEDPDNVSVTLAFLYQEKLAYFIDDEDVLYVNKITAKRNRSASKYIKWRNSVFERDNYTCCRCKSRGIKLNAHHIKGWAQYPQLRFAINNGITFCEQCHKNLHREERCLWRKTKNIFG